MLSRLAWRAVLAREKPGWRASLREVRAWWGLPPAAFRARRDDLLARHLAWARARVPWVRRLGAAAGRLEDLPVLGRRDLQAHREDLRDETRDPATLEVESSGGSTGEPVRVYTDAACAAWAQATTTHVWETWGVPFGARRAFLWGDDRGRAALPWRDRVKERLLGIRFLDAFEMDRARMAAFSADLEAFRPVLLQGYATALDLLAGFLLEEGRWAVRPRVVQSAAEALAPAQRERIQRAFGAPVRDFYGSRESPCLAAECAAGGYHVMAHGRVVELVDGDGRPVPPGVPGRVLVTDLVNRAFALLRYENGDVASWSPDAAPCPCGCPFPRLERVHGRTSDFLTTPAGERIHGEWFTHLFYGVSGVERFQVRQRDLRDVEVLTVGPAGEEALAPVLARMCERLGADVAVRWRRVEAIPLTPAGKRRFTLSDVPFGAARP